MCLLDTTYILNINSSYNQLKVCNFGKALIENAYSLILLTNWNFRNARN
uniref:Uncharacterized protein n=1 Tax=Rhizophora mucronata TaxID=61149 RepID=A0A2P2QTE7_RHIMU